MITILKFAIWILFIALLIAFASSALIPEEQYLPPAAEEEQVVAEQPLEESSAALAKDGYRYKTVRKLRHRRDVSELFAQGTLAEDGYHYHAPQPSAAPLLKVAPEYLPPVEEATENKEVVKEAPKISNEYLPPTNEVEVTTEKKEITEAPSAAAEISREYLPPTEAAAATLDIPKFAAEEELPLDDDAVIIEGPEESSILADDGYHYRRIRYRRDVSETVPSAGYAYEAPSAEDIKSAYIPPAEVKEAIAEPSVNDEVVKEYLPPVAEIKEAPETAKLADDGYRYKTVRKLKYRQRRDVSEIVSATPVKEEVESTSAASIEYLPPTADVEEVADVKEASGDVPAETAELAEDGYRYKTIRKLKYRQRRDVSHIVAAPESAVLADDGYHYRIPEPTQVIPKVSNEYLPPSAELKELTEEPKEVVTSTEAPVVVTESTPVITESTTVVTEAAPSVTEATTTEATEAPSTTTTTTPIPVISKEYLPPLEDVPLIKEAIESPSTTAAPVVSNEYLPPVEEIAQIKEAPEVPEETAVLADDGYHYKVGKRFRFRRDVSEIIAPANGYAYEAPAESSDAINIYLPPAEVKAAVPSTEAPQVSSEYLPPAEESKNDAEIIEAPEESAVLADDGYHYKTVRRLKYRSRRDVSEIAIPLDGYLYSAPAVVAEEESSVLADDGYRYKTVRRLKYRHRRDVSELVAPVEESAILAEDGYHYKTPPSTVLPKVANEYLPPVEDVAEVKEALIIEPTIAPEVSNEYLPPSEATPKEASTPSNEYLPPTENIKGSAEIVEVPEESAILADDGYRYKTVRRIRYRHRRDVSELANQQAEGYSYSAPVEIEPQEIQYLPPVEEVAQVKEATDSTATLADDGYLYKTVKRYRHRV
ncbi:fibrous sheath CABYR-binding protein-like [Episyrphus balteatus]|uniref:fibrous sheath CABYR-binding protein-like n=1 Tax=Episyrphus balteatus TaxID=286459 RepID=UPI00248550E6|nr:fibrous sheath CABYR-binding protein-like [Episyrphus balteatus]